MTETRYEKHKMKSGVVKMITIKNNKPEAKELMKEDISTMKEIFSILSVIILPYISVIIGTIFATYLIYNRMITYGFIVWIMGFVLALPWRWFIVYLMED